MNGQLYTKLVSRPADLAAARAAGRRGDGEDWAAFVLSRRAR